jgi:hypothetical protein
VTALRAEDERARPRPAGGARVASTQKVSIEEWRRVHEASLGTTYFHGPAWAELWEAYTDGALTPAPVRVELSDGATAILGVTRSPTRIPLLERSLLSPEGCCGGWVSETALSTEQRRAIARHVVGMRSVVWRIGPADGDLLDDPPPGGREETTHLMSLVDGAEAARSRFRESSRQRVKRARRAGVVTRRSDDRRDWQAYGALYAAGVEAWERPLWVYRPELFELLADRSGPSVRLYLAERDGELCAGEVVFVHKDHAIAWHGASNRSLVPGCFNLLEWEVVGLLADEGVRVYDQNGSGGLSGVIAFKESLGAVPSRVLAYDRPHPLESVARRTRRLLRGSRS